MGASIKAMYRAQPALCFSCCMKLAVGHLAKCEESGRQCCCPDVEEVCEGDCETDGCLEPYLFDEDDDDTQARCFDCWARDQIGAQMRPEEDKEEEGSEEDGEEGGEEEVDSEEAGSPSADTEAELIEARQEAEKQYNRDIYDQRRLREGLLH